MNRRRLRQTGALVASWLLVAVPVAVLVFADGEKRTALAGHDAVVSPTFDGYATLDLGPYLPNLRYPTDRWLGARIDLGKTTLTSYEDLVDRYALLGAQPEGEVSKVVSALRGLAVDSAVSGALAGLAGPALWVLLGPRRRAELCRHVTPGNTGAAALGVVVLASAVFQPWDRRDAALEQQTAWRPIAEEVPDIPLPEQAEPLEVEAGLFTTGTKRIAESLMSSYSKGFAFYSEVAESVPEIEDRLRRPEDGETVALLVSDRHDNVGMDKVAHAIGAAAGATVLLDAGDDTSTGSSWEAFSLDSLDRVFADYEHRYAVTGNHDEGEFVGDYLERRGFERFHGEAAEGPEGIRLLGADDPRSSGLGSWRDESGLSFTEHAERVADQACEYDEQGERISTLLVHDANTGRYALERGCVDLVVGGHVHEPLGPTEFLGENGQVGYSFTTGTTGGAAYAIAVGSKPRRNAMVTLVTYREGRPVGLQPVTVRTVGDFEVSPYIALDPPVGVPAPLTPEVRAGQLGEPGPTPGPTPGTTNGPDEARTP